MELTGEGLKTIERSITGEEGQMFKFAGGDIGTILSSALPIIFFAAGAALLFYLLSGGFKLMTSAGDPKKVEGGKKIIMNAIIGFVIIFVAYWLVQIVGLALGLKAISGSIISIFK